MDLRLLANLLGVPDLERRLGLVEERLTQSLGVDGPTLAPASRRVAGALGGLVAEALAAFPAAYLEWALEYFTGSSSGQDVG